MITRTRALDDDDPILSPPHEDGESPDFIALLIIELLRPLVARFLAERGIPAFVGAHQTIAWVKADPSKHVTPDVFVMPGFFARGLMDLPDAWKLWEEGVIPCFALEILDADGKKDRAKLQAAYDDLGVEELLIFDPYARAIEPRARFHIHRRSADGKLVCVESTCADYIKSAALDLHLRATGQGIDLRLRVATGNEAQDLFPTEHERAELKRAELQKLRLDIARRSS